MGLGIYHNPKESLNKVTQSISLSPLSLVKGGDNGLDDVYRKKGAWCGQWGIITDKNMDIVVKELQENKQIHEMIEKVLQKSGKSKSLNNIKKIRVQITKRVLPYCVEKGRQ